MGLIELNESSGVPIWVQIRNRMAYLIESGYFQPGEQLPTIRKLAADLGINYHTCSKAYTMLESEGLIVSKRGRGTTVREDFRAGGEKAATDVIMEECILQCLDLGMRRSEIKARFAELLDGVTSL